MSTASNLSQQKLLSESMAKLDIHSAASSLTTDNSIDHRSSKAVHVPISPLQQSRFFDLPAEVRNQIYEHLFRTSGAGLLINRTKVHFCRPRVDLTQTCRLIRKETLQMYYAVTPVLIKFDYYQPDFSQPSATMVAAIESWRDHMDAYCPGWYMRDVRVRFYEYLGRHRGMLPGVDELIVSLRAIFEREIPSIGMRCSGNRCFGHARVSCSNIEKRQINSISSRSDFMWIEGNGAHSPIVENAGDWLFWKS